MFLGIDIAKDTFDVALIKNNEDAKKPRHKRFANTAAGHRQLLCWLADHQVQQVHACLEATGTYGEALALSLVEAGHPVSVVNPARISAFAKSQLSRTKTDKADAQLIATFCQTQKPALWTPPPVEARELQALVRRLAVLEEMLQMERNRLDSLGSSGSEGLVRGSLVEHIAHLEAQVQKTEQAIRAHINAHPSLKGRRDLLVSIPGVGETTAATLLAELPDVTQFSNARAVAAFAGLVPRIRQSGSSVRSRPRLSKTGSPRLRGALYWPAITALRFNPLLKAMKERLTQRGKSKMAIIGAAMRKLLCLAYGILKSGKPFDPNFSAHRT
ncbi:MAG TPA: transposase [Chloroflexota bacterium]|nr:transposase [Chloroflexota bacterium]